MKPFVLHIIFHFISLFLFHSALAQYKVKGTVFDNTRLYTIEAVTVESSAGKATMTDSLGRYQLEVGEKDTIWFSFLGKPTPKYPVSKIEDLSNFDIALNLSMVTRGEILPEVRIRSRIYKEDSLLNRREYAKVFDFSRPTIGSMTSVTSTGAGIDIGELIRLFQFRKNRSMERFRERLIQEEQDKFIDHRFNKPLIKRLTGLEGQELDAFAIIYRPSYEACLLLSEYDFQLYIKKAGEEFSKKSF